MKARFQTPLKLESSEKSLSMSFSVSASEIRFKNAPIKITQDRIMNTQTGITLVLNHEDIIIGQIIGQGSCGVVQVAQHVPSNTPLAIKCFDVYRKSKINQLKNDLTILDRCQSPYLVKFYGAWYIDGQVKVALELMDLGSAAKIPTPVPEQYLKNIAFQILCGLDSLHSQHELHRDIKPENVLLNSKGEVKLADFGISKDLQSTVGLCKTFVGTPSYMSPERMSGKEYGLPSDIWSVGVLLLELANGNYPYPKTRRQFEMVCNIIALPEPRASNESSPEFQDFIICCLQKDPQLRASTQRLLNHPWLSQPIPELKEWINSS